MIFKNRKHLIFYAFFILVPMALFWRLLSGEYRFLGGDSLSPNAVQQAIEASINRIGEYPYWLPWIFSGLPSTHSFQNISGYYYPDIFFDLFRYFGIPEFWNFIFHFTFGSIGMFLLLKKMKLDDLPAFFGAISFTNMPYLVTMIVHGHGSQMMTTVYFPWCILGMKQLMGTFSYQKVGFLSLFVGLQLQRGHVQIAYYTWMLMGFYFLFYIFKLFRSKQNLQLYQFLSIPTSWMLGLCLSLSIYLPALFYTPESIRGMSRSGGTGLDYATQWSYSFSEALTMLFPSFYGFGGPYTYWGSMPFTDYPNYMGIIILILAKVLTVLVPYTYKWATDAILGDNTAPHIIPIVFLYFFLIY